MSRKDIVSTKNAVDFAKDIDDNFKELYNGQGGSGGGGGNASYEVVYDELDCLLKGGVYIQYNSGEESTFSASDYCVSDYLPVYGSSLTIKQSFSAMANPGIAFYDSAKSFISGLRCNFESETTITIPAGAKYVRLSNKRPTKGWPMQVKMTATGDDAFTAMSAEISKYKSGERGTLNVVHFGNSFTANTMNDLGSICSAIGVNSAKVSVQYANHGASSLQTWVDTYLNGGTSISLSNAYGKGYSGGTLRDILSKPWDVVVFQQVSSSSGDYSSFQPYLGILMDAVRRFCPNKDVKIMFMMTWERTASPAVTFADIITANKSLAATCGQILGNIIPTGTALENVRGTSLNSGDSASKFMKDGYHLAVGVGEYTAGCCFYQRVIAPFVGKDVDEDVTTTIASSGGTGSVAVTADNRILCQQAAMYACIDPWQVTSIDES